MLSFFFLLLYSFFLQSMEKGDVTLKQVLKKENTEKRDTETDQEFINRTREYTQSYNNDVLEREGMSFSVKPELRHHIKTFALSYDREDFLTEKTEIPKNDEHNDTVLIACSPSANAGIVIHEIINKHHAPYFRGIVHLYENIKTEKAEEFFLYDEIQKFDEDYCKRCVSVAIADQQNFNCLNLAKIYKKSKSIYTMELMNSKNKIILSEEIELPLKSIRSCSFNKQADKFIVWDAEDNYSLYNLYVNLKGEPLLSMQLSNT